MARLFVLGVFLVLFAGFSARADGAVVIAVTNGGDAIVEGTETFSVPEGAVVTLIREDGQIVQIQGPFSGVVESGDKGTDEDTDWNALTIFLTGPRDSVPALGAARVADKWSDLPDQPDVWQVSIDSSGPRCVRPGPVELWRRDAERDARVSIRTEAGRLGDLSWPQAEHGLKLPADFSVVDGRMAVSLDDTVRTLTVAVLPDDLVGAPTGRVLTWLIDQQCSRQARTLIDALHSGQYDAAEDGISK